MKADVTEKLLADPREGISLEELAAELNALARVRDSARIAFCKRLAVAYLLVVGHRPQNGSQDGVRFYDWCEKKIKSASGKRYTASTLRTYLLVGFSGNPEKMMRKRSQISTRIGTHNRQVGSALAAAVRDNSSKVVSLRELRRRGVPSNVAQEVNTLMRAWEEASPEARAQFIYAVTGKRLAA